MLSDASLVKVWLGLGLVRFSKRSGFEFNHVLCQGLGIFFILVTIMAVIWKKQCWQSVGNRKQTVISIVQVLVTHPFMWTFSGRLWPVCSGSVCTTISGSQIYDELKTSLMSNKVCIFLLYRWSFYNILHNVHDDHCPMCCTHHSLECWEVWVLFFLRTVYTRTSEWIKDFEFLSNLCLHLSGHRVQDKLTLHAAVEWKWNKILQQVRVLIIIPYF